MPRIRNFLATSSGLLIKDIRILKDLKHKFFQVLVIPISEIIIRVMNILEASRLADFFAPYLPTLFVPGYRNHFFLIRAGDPVRNSKLPIGVSPDLPQYLARREEKYSRGTGVKLRTVSLQSRDMPPLSPASSQKIVWPFFSYFSLFSTKSVLSLR